MTSRLTAGHQAAHFDSSVSRETFSARHEYCVPLFSVLYCAALEVRVRGRSLFGAAVLFSLLLGAGPAFAGPFADVPLGHWAYPEATILAKAGLLRPQDERALSSHSSLTRYDFAVLLLGPLSALERLGGSSDRDGADSAVVRALEQANMRDRRRLGLAISRLAREFDDVIRLMGEPYKMGLSSADTMAATGRLPTSAPRASDPPSTLLSAFSAQVRGAKVGLGYRPAATNNMALEYTAAARFAPPVTRAPAPGANANRPILGDLGLSGLRATVEYGLADDLRLTLAYEALLREAAGAVTPDPTRLGSVGLAYRLSGSTDVRLNYGLIARRDSTETLRIQDRLASAQLTVRF
jgi:hypothetical protein